MTADRLDFLDNILRTSPFRAFERHVFQQMRDTIDFRRFVPGAAANPHTTGNRLHTRHRFRDDPHAVLKHRDLHAHAAP